MSAEAEKTAADRVPLVVIVGPTAAGKTAAAVELADRIGGEIVNADSMQVYRYMDIGTAKPDASQRAQGRFHLLDVAVPDRQITVSDWKSFAEAAISVIRSRRRIPIICGGTGLYVRALLDNWSLASTPADAALRERLTARIATEGSTALHAELAAVDPTTAERLHPNDAVRIVRALEVFHAYGQPISAFQNRDRAGMRRFDARMFGLALPRPQLYERIETRVDAMLADGLEIEVRGLLDRGYSTQLGPMRGLGYKEMAQFVNGELNHSDMVSAIKQNTRRYAKRQMTWFRADKEIEWIDVAASDSATVASRIVTMLEQDPQYRYCS